MASNGRTDAGAVRSTPTPGQIRGHRAPLQREGDTAKPLSRALSAKAWSDSEEKDQGRDNRARFGEELAVADVEGEHGSGGDIHLARKCALFECAAAIVAQDLGDAPEVVDKASDASVCRTHQGPARFNAAKNGIGEMLMGAGRTKEPTIVSHRHQEIGPIEDEATGELPNSILEANERRDMATVA